MNTPFHVLYSMLNRDYGGKDFWGDKWCGPAVLPHAAEVLIARFPKDPDDGDGQEVEVYCSAYPARFYRLNVLPGPNSIGERHIGYGLSTGSSEHELAHRMAVAISQGMLGLVDRKEPQPLDFSVASMMTAPEPTEA